MPASQTPAGGPPPSRGHPLLQGKDQLLLISGSSDGCVRLHTQSVEAVDAAKMPTAGQLLEGGLLWFCNTLHDVDLLGVTCLAVKQHADARIGKMGT